MLCSEHGKNILAISHVMSLYWSANDDIITYQSGGRQIVPHTSGGTESSVANFDFSA
jgi:hypothetical protein